MDLQDEDALQEAIDSLNGECDEIAIESACLEDFLERKFSSIEIPETVGGKLSLQEKVDIVNDQMEFLAKQKETQKDTSKEYVINLRCKIEEREIRVSELRKELFEFKREVLGGESSTVKVVHSEKLLKFVEDNLRAMDIVVNKLNSRTGNVRSQIRKMEHDLKQKEEMGETLLPIDFDELKIENQQLLEQIEAKNGELLRLKLATGRTTQVLNSLKNKLQRLKDESEAVENHISEKENFLCTVKSDINAVEGDIEKALALNSGLQGQLTRMSDGETVIPDTLDYVRVIQSSRELSKEATNLSHKIKLGEREVKLLTSRLARYGGENMHQIMCKWKKILHKFLTHFLKDLSYSNWDSW